MPTQMTDASAPTWRTPAISISHKQSGDRSIVAYLAGLTFVLAGIGSIGVLHAIRSDIPEPTFDKLNGAEDLDVLSVTFLLSQLTAYAVLAPAVFMLCQLWLL